VGEWGRKRYDWPDHSRLGSWTGWILQLVEIGTDSRARSVDVMEVGRPNDLGDIANLGLTLSEAKQVLARI
jgi:hypothetical protein